MQLPTAIKLGSTRYTVEPIPGTIKPGCLGHISYDAKTIMVSTHKNARMRSDSAIAQTFWHEVTHGILKDMGHRLESNEEFVDQFSRRLSDAIRSAKF